MFKDTKSIVSVIHCDLFILVDVTVYLHCSSLFRNMSNLFFSGETETVT